MITKDIVYAGILGGVVGDALGVPYEFKSRSDMTKYPATTMRGYGTYRQPPGTWSDDSSMTIATLDSLANGLDYEDLMIKFCQWIIQGEYTQYGNVFDYGNTTYSALRNYWDKKLNPLKCGLDGAHDNGNGSLMRIMPVILYVNAKGLAIDKQVGVVGAVSSLTHAHSISKASCNIYNFISQEVIDHPDKSFKTLITDGIDKSRKCYDNNKYECFNTLYNSLFSLSEDYIFSDGYVVSSLEVALYCCYHTSNYEEAVLKAVNTGGDTDTNAMITGALAGLYYGYNNIPSDWLTQIARIDYIKSLCDKFYNSVK